MVLAHKQHARARRGVRDLNRLEPVGETLWAALNAIAAAALDWLCGVVPPDWYERYDRRIEKVRLPPTGPKRDAYAAQVGADGFVLHGMDVPQEAATLPTVDVLHRVWARHFERVEAGPSGGARLRPVHGRGPGGP